MNQKLVAFVFTALVLIVSARNATWVDGEENQIDERRKQVALKIESGVMFAAYLVMLLSTCGYTAAAVAIGIYFYTPKPGENRTTYKFGIL